MIEIFFVATLSALFGGLFRLWLGEYKQHLMRDVVISILIGLSLGLISLLYQESIFILPLTLEKYIGMTSLFFMTGYVFCDLIDSFIFIARRLIKRL